MTQRSNESFKEYGLWWRELVARVQTSILDKELIGMFMGTLHTQYMENMVGSSFWTFSEVVSLREQIESQLKKGKIPYATIATNEGKKPYSNFHKKPEGEPMPSWEDVGSNNRFHIIK